jgi:hypothetical protein
VHPVSLLRGKHIPPLLSAHFPKYALDFHLFQIKHYAPRASANTTRAASKASSTPSSSRGKGALTHSGMSMVLGVGYSKYD